MKTLESTTDVRGGCSVQRLVSGRSDLQPTKQERTFNELALFAGCGGGILAGKILGWRTVCAVEYDEHARDVLKARQDDGCLEPFPIWDDVRTFNGKPWRGLVDVVSGGFPCQDISAANYKAEGITGSRSGLWSEMARIVSEVRPSNVFIENSPMLVGRGLAVVLCDLAEMGYDAAWGIMGACHAGLAHKRERCWVYAYDNENDGAASGVPERERTTISLTNWRTPKNVEEWGGWLGELAAMDVVSRVSSYAEGRRAFYGLPDGMDRLARLGNSQVPRVAAIAYSTLRKLYHE
jgi:DNA (cytosine-5)-methyltransferase 1